MRGNLQNFSQFLSRLRFSHTLQLKPIYFENDTGFIGRSMRQYLRIQSLFTHPFSVFLGWCLQFHSPKTVTPRCSNCRGGGGVQSKVLKDSYSTYVSWINCVPPLIWQQFSNKLKSILSINYRCINTNYETLRYKESWRYWPTHY